MEGTNAKKLNIVFMGTPAFAATILQTLLGRDNMEVRAVFTQPDRPCGRGQKCLPSEVKKLAFERGLPVFQPASLKNNQAALTLLEDIKPDMLIVAAYGLILPAGVLSLPPLGCLNVHASLLPRYRGAAPIQRAIMAGEQETGISIMLMGRGLDSGPVLLSAKTPIKPDETAGELYDRLAEIGGRLLIDAVGGWADRSIKAQPQDDRLASYAAKIEKSEAAINWRQEAEQVHNHIRAMTPWPGAFYDWSRADGRPCRLTLLPGRCGPAMAPDTPPGTIVGLVEGSIGVACLNRLYLLDKIIPAGKRMQDAVSFACGYLTRDRAICK